jgi:hypothetical protein
MLNWETERADAFYWFKDGKLLTQQTPDGACIAVPGNIMWKSDLEALRKIAAGAESATTLNSVAAKYFLNQ